MTFIRSLPKFLISAAALSLAVMTAHAEQMSPSEALSRIHAIHQEEISMGKMAQDKGLAPEIKKFGGQLEKDHRNADDKLKALAESENIKLSSPAAKSLAGASQTVKKTTTLGQLKALSGAKFDEAFVDAVEDGHSDALALLQNIQTPNENVQSYIQSILPELRSHQQALRDLKPIVQKEM